LSFYVIILFIAHHCSVSSVLCRCNLATGRASGLREGMFEQFPKVYFISLTWSNSGEVDRLKQTEISFSSSILFVPYSSRSVSCIHGEPEKLCYFSLDHNFHVSWWICTPLVPMQTGKNTLQRS